MPALETSAILSLYSKTGGGYNLVQFGKILYRTVAQHRLARTSPCTPHPSPSQTSPSPLSTKTNPTPHKHQRAGIS